MEKIFIGVAWPYANGFLHLGHFAGSLLPPDIFKRYHKLKGNEVLMVSGSDMHGTPITVTADKEGVTPEEVAERFHEINKQSIEKMDVDFDIYTSTHTENHFRIVKEIFKDLYEKNYILRRSSMEQFCPSCKKFLPDRYVEGKCPKCGSEGARGDQCDSCGITLDPEELVDPKCKICGGTPETKETEHFYFRLSAFEDMLIQYLADKNHWRDNTKNFTDNWLRDGLKDRPITRDITWGIDIPFEGYDDKRIYVWFEAVCGYFTSTVEYSKKIGKPDLWKEFWQDPECKSYYFMGKDNIPFHTIIWPAILMGVGDRNLPYDIPANEYLMLNNEQFSKSRNHAIWLPSFLKRYDVDPLRFYLSITMPENKDTDFTWEDYVRRNNTELVGAMGNFIHRVLTFTKKNFSAIPEPKDLDEEDRKMLDALKEKMDKESEQIYNCKFKNGILEMMELCHMANRYFSNKKPWDTVKDDKDVCANTMSVSISVIKGLAVMMFPYLPSTGLKLWKLLGEGDEIPSWDAGLESPKYGYELPEVQPLFKKLDLKTIQEQEATAGAVDKEVEQEGKPLISFEEFQKMDLRVGKIVEVLDHPKADKLYIMKVDLGGDDVRQIVAGLKESHTKEELLNKQAAFVVNLEPVVLRGEKSDGMILAAEDDTGKISLVLSEKEVINGAAIK